MPNIRRYTFSFWQPSCNDDVTGGGPMEAPIGTFITCTQIDSTLEDIHKNVKNHSLWDNGCLRRICSS